MILIHESMPAEAAHVARTVQEKLGIDCQIRDEIRDDLFPMISDPGWNGCHASAVMDRLDNAFRGQGVLMLTRRDLYDFRSGRSPDDFWMFGVTRPDDALSLVSVARLLGTSSRPTPTLEVPEDRYNRRLATLAVHEIGHVLTDGAPHHKEAEWVNATSPARDRLGSHCDEPACIMYPTVDVRTPEREQGYMEFTETADRRFDAGLDDQLLRLGSDWFCGRCRAAMKVPDSYHAM